MSTIPTWLGATAGQPGYAGQVNQFLGAHTTQFIYAGALQASNTVNGSAHVMTNSTYLAQQFTTGAAQTTIGYVMVPLTTYASAVTAQISPTTISLYANGTSAPTGSPLVTATVTPEYAYNASGGVETVALIYPMPVTGLSVSTPYWLVTSPAGDGTNHFIWRESSATSGASTSTNGTTWTAQTYGLQYSIYDATTTGSLTATWEDAGMRWSAYTYSPTGLLLTIAEYTIAQGTNGYVQGFHTLAYSGRDLKTVT